MSEQEQAEIDYSTPLGQPSDAGSYKQMIPATPLAKDEGPADDFSGNRSGLEKAAEEMRREPTRQEIQAQRPIERSYQQTAGEHVGERSPSNEAITPEQGAHDLHSIRAAERQQELDAVEQILRDEIDGVRGQVQDQPPIEQQPIEQPPIEQHQVESNPLVERLQRDPELLEAVRTHVGQIENQVVTARQQYEQAASQNAQAALSALMIQFPEIQGVNTQQELVAVIQAVAHTNPDRAQQIKAYLGRISGVVDEANRVQQVQQAEYAQNQQQQFQRQAEAVDTQFDNYAKSQVGAEQYAEIQKEARAMFNSYGVDDKTLAALWNSNPAIRSFAGQALIMDAARFRLATQAARGKASRAVPTMMTPGAGSVERGSERDYSLGKLSAQLDRDASVKSATNYLIAKRASRGR